MHTAVVAVHHQDQAGSPFNEVVLGRKLHLLKVGAELRHGLLEKDVERVEVRSHQGVVDTEESKVRRAVEKVCQTDEGIGSLHVE